MSSREQNPIRVLMVLPTSPTGAIPPWASRQIVSLANCRVQSQCFFFSNRKSLYGLLANGLALRKAAKRFDADIVHVHFGAAQALAAVASCQRPVVVSYCGSDLFGNYSEQGKLTWSGKLSRLMSQMAAFGARRTIAKTLELKSQLISDHCRSRCEVIPNGANLELFQPMGQGKAREQLGWNHERPTVLFHHRHGAWVKNPQLASSIIELARKTIPNLDFRIVENEAPERMPLFFNAADALLLTSRHEGSNNTVKEAMACNLPIISTRCGDVPERIESVSHSYSCPTDKIIMSERLVEVLQNRQRSNGREFIADLSEEDIARRVRDFYEITLEDSSSGDSPPTAIEPLSRTPMAARTKSLVTSNS